MPDGAAIVPADPMVTDIVEMSHDDRLFVAIYLEYGKVTQAAMEAYQEPDPVKAGRIGNAALLRMPEVFSLVMDREGLTDKDLLKRLIEGLNANKTVFAKYRGAFCDERQVIDHQTRAMYLRMGLDLRGHTPKAALTLQDDAGRPLGPVILPVRSDGHLPPLQHIQEAEVIPEPVDADGGGAQVEGGGIPDTSITNASPIPEGGLSGGKIVGGDEETEGW